MAWRVWVREGWRERRARRGVRGEGWWWVRGRREVRVEEVEERRERFIVVVVGRWSLKEGAIGEA